MVHGFVPRIRLSAVSTEPALDPLSPPLSLPLHSLYCLSKVNKTLKKEDRYRYIDIDILSPVKKIEKERGKEKPREKEREKGRREGERDREREIYYKEELAYVLWKLKNPMICHMQAGGQGNWWCSSGPRSPENQEN